MPGGLLDLMQAEIDAPWSEPLTDSEIDALGMRGIEKFPTLFNRVPWGGELKTYVRQLARAIESNHRIAEAKQ